jgi:hypothetical protein
MFAPTSKISNHMHDAETSRVNSEVRSAALVWIVSLLFTGLLTLRVCLLGITPGWSGTPDAQPA